MESSIFPCIWQNCCNRHTIILSTIIFYKLPVYIFYGIWGNVGSEVKKIPEKPYITRLFEGAASFELDRSRRFTGDVVEDSVDMRDFIDDP